jgi:hypothetical protein
MELQDPFGILVSPCSDFHVLIHRADPTAREGKRILCLDWGGVRSLSSLWILKRIMEQVESFEETKKPCECFDLIGGSGVGGLIAIMLGRLRMVRLYMN